MGYRFTLEEGPGKEKITCPSCGHDGVFTRFVDTTTDQYCDDIYGMCDRALNCKYVNRPLNNYKMDEESEFVTRTSKSIYDSEYIKMNWKPKNEGLSNNLIKGLIRKYGEEKVLPVVQNYQIFDYDESNTVYPFTINSNLITGKIIEYDDNLKRKNGVDWLHSLVTLDENGEPVYLCEENVHKKRVLPLFGWDLIAKYPDKFICVTEGEKTAIVGSIVFPEYVWVAVGSLKWLQSYKFPEYNNRVWLFFPDLKAKEDGGNYYDYWQNQINKIKIESGYKLKYSSIVDYTNERTEPHFFEEKADIADIINSYRAWDWASENVDGRMQGKLDNYLKIIRNKIDETVDKM